MTGLFSKPKAPVIQQAPAQATRQDAALEALDEAERLRKRKGRLSNMLSGSRAKRPGVGGAAGALGGGGGGSGGASGGGGGSGGAGTPSGAYSGGGIPGMNFNFGWLN